MTDLIPLASTALAGPNASQIIARMREWAEDAKGSFSPNTERAWRADWACFVRWCEAAELLPLPAQPRTVARYLREMSSAGKAVATVRRRASTIARAHASAGLPNPCDSEPVRLAMRKIVRERGTDQKKAKGLTRADVERIAASIGADTPAARAKDVRDIALMLVGYDLLTRGGELGDIRAEAITWKRDGAARVMLRRRKTDKRASPYMIGRSAATALRRWLERSGITAGPVFQGVTKQGTRKGGNPTGIAIDRSNVSRVIKALAKRAGIEVDVSSHSLRVGMAEELVKKGIGLALVMKAANWRTPEMAVRYTEHLDADAGAIAQYYEKES